MSTAHRWSSQGPSAFNLREPGGAGSVHTRIRTASPARCGPRQLVACGLLLLAVGACGSTPPATGDAAAAAPSGAGRGRPQADQPLGIEPDAVAPYIQELLHDYDDIVHQFTLDPTMADEADHPLASELSALFDSDSEVPQLMLDSWANDYARPPERDNQPALISTLDTVETVSDDEVQFSVCTRQRIYAYDEATRQMRGIGYEDAMARGSAQRIDGTWLLHDIRVADRATCEEEEEEEGA